MSANGGQRGERPLNTAGPTLADVGEEGLVARLVSAALQDPNPLRLGPGDDAALWQMPGGGQLAITQDAVVEGVDFEWRWTTRRDVGRKAAAVALSDLAAMGAVPVWCVATLCAPATTPVDDVLAVQQGLRDVLSEAGAALAGGDVSEIAGPLVIDVCAAGTLEGDGALRRDAGHPGDALLVTGRLGRAAAGLRLLRDGDGSGVAMETMERWLAAQRTPSPRIAEGRRLLEQGVACACDISDGLAVDAGRIAAASRVGAELWLRSLPVDAELAAAFGDRWPELALGGGEDFELLAALPAEHVDGLLRAWPAHLAPLSIVGRLVEGDGVRLLDTEGGARLPLPAPSSLHFARRRG